MSQATCSIDGCHRSEKTRGWCGTHYERWRIHGSTDLPPRKVRERRPDCSVQDCTSESQPSHGMCKRHYSHDYYRRNRVHVCAAERAERAAETPAQREQRLQSARESYLRHRRARLAHEAARYADDPLFAQRKRDTANAWRIANAEHVRAVKQAHYEQNKALINARAAAYYAEHRDEMREANRAWIQANPDRARQLARNAKGRRRAREHGGRVTKTDLATILAEHGMVCHICGDDIADGDLHFDHVIPLAKGGPHSPENIRPAHASCNRRKAARLTA